MVNKKIALVLRTGDLEYDDRVRKEIISIQAMFSNITFKVFVLYDDNIAKEGVTSYGVPYKAISLKTRDKYAQASKLFLKAYEMYLAVKEDIKHFDAVWCADIETIMVVLLCGKRPLIWDLHELPMALIGNRAKRGLLKIAFRKCEVVFHANQYRIDYLAQLGALDKVEKHLPVRNFPDFEQAETDRDDSIIAFSAWRKGRDCFYLQGLSGESRAPYESLAAILRVPNLCAVVMGGINQEVLSKLQFRYGAELIADRIRFEGLVNVLKTPLYMRECFASMIFYKNYSPNNWLCEANRLYQTISEGLVVISGNNPPLKEIVEGYKLGVAIDSDGSDEDLIFEGIKDIINNKIQFQQNVALNKNRFLWKTQEPILNTVVNKIFFK